MIRKVRLWDFKNFEFAELSLGPFSVILGINASGKSNIRDAFRFLHGIGRGYTIAEIIGGRYGAGGQSEWEQMRGAASEIVRFGEDSFQLEVWLLLAKRRFKYTIQVKKYDLGRRGFRLEAESLAVNGEIIFTSYPDGDDPIAMQEDPNFLALRMAKAGRQRRLGARASVRRDQPALTQLSEVKNVSRAHRDLCDEVIEALGSIRFLDLSPDLMRKPAFPGQNILGDNGENLPTVLQDICTSEKKKGILTEWIRELTPMDVVDFKFTADPITGLVQLSLQERDGTEVSAYSASDGTLRFLAMLAALLGNNPAKLYFFEEIDNGIHPARLRLLLDLIETQTGKGGVQVITTTHSPEFLSMLSDDAFDNASTVYRDEESHSADIKRLSDLPRMDQLRKKQSLSSLHASGWIEDTLSMLGAKSSHPQKGISE